jgi:Relaxase/Mobilisation nuclease domain.
MVAKISSGVSLFGALSYNQEKVDEGVADVLYSQNIIRSVDGSFNIPMCMRSFEPYLTANKKTVNPVIHISLNPHPDDVLTNEQLTLIAQEYMDKLGYGKQPYLVYKHEDIDRAHIHIVSVRIDETGKKINDSYERKRSKDITRSLEKKYNLTPAEKKRQSENPDLKRINPRAGDVKKQVSGTVKALMRDYRFQSIYEYRALLSLYGLTVEEVKGEVKGKPYNGLVYSVTDKKGEKVGNPFKASLIGKTVGYDALQKHIRNSKEALTDKNLKERSKERIVSVMQKTGSRKQFEKELLKQGISVVFRENDEGRIYGITFIDHNEKAVLNGSKLSKELSANVFNERFNGNNKSEEREQLSENPFDSHYDKLEENTSTAEAVAGILSMEQHGDDYVEIAFTNRMRRKKKKKRGRSL